MLLIDETKARELIDAMSDEYSRKILAATLAEGKTPEEISHEQSVPISTCYRRIRDLANKSILRVSHIELASGRKLVFYKSVYKSFEFKFEPGNSNYVVEVAFNTLTPEERLAGMVSDMRVHKTVTGDCDLCQSHALACKVLEVGESRSRILVCSRCQEEMEKGEIPANLPGVPKNYAKPSKEESGNLEVTA